MEFVQIVEFSTTRIDEVRALSDKFRADSAAEGAATPARVTVGADRDTADRYVVVAEFGSYEEAMANSQRATTAAFAEEMGKLCDGPRTFRNLDVAERFQA